jgi:hypothetical protein
MKNILIVLIAVVFLLACNDKNKKSAPAKMEALNKYYYPLQELSGDGLVYEYLNDSLKIVADYWLYKTVKDESGDLFLIAAGYNSLYEQTAFSRESIVVDGTLLKDYQFYVTDSASGKSIITAAKIEENVYFPFKPTIDSGKVYRYRMKTKLPPDTTLNFDIVRDRRFDKFLDYEFEGKKLAAVQFLVTEYYNAFDNTNKGGDFKVTSEIKEIYAEGIGLVFIEKKGEAISYRNRLKRRISPDEFIKMQTENK